MKKVILSLLVVGFAVAFSSCGKKEAKPVETPVETPAVVEAPAAPAVEVSAEEKAFLAVVDKLDPANKCTVCHHATNAGVGPNYTEVAKIYKEKGGDLTKFLKGNAKAIVLPERFAEMQANLEVTKKLSGDDLKALTDYIRSLE
ncbi:MAG: cytochrome c [Flavobacteriaceae bacterium]|nr:cytochrome c [Flavobacteriaceae bacterium]